MDTTISEGGDYTLPEIDLRASPEHDMHVIEVNNPERRH